MTLIFNTNDKTVNEQVPLSSFFSLPVTCCTSWLAACGGGTAGAQGAAEGHASPPGGEAAAAGGAEATGQGERAGERNVLPATDTQPG